MQWSGERLSEPTWKLLDTHGVGNLKKGTSKDGRGK